MALAAASLLSACGGDDDGPSADAAAGPPPAATTAAINIAGTAAAGAALAGATVEAKCATGSASGTTAADGSYSLAIAGGAFPCLLRVTPASGAVLHSIALAAATAAGSSARANLTPVTHLVIADLGAVDPASYYAAFSATIAAALTPAALAGAETAVIATLKAAGIDLTSTADPVSTPLSAKNGSVTGDAYDRALEQLAAAFVRSGTTLASLTASVASTAAAALSPATVVTASVPAELLLQPAAANCSSLRSSTYRVVAPVPGSTLAAQAGLWTIDAATLGVVRADGSASTWVANGNCRFSAQGSAYSADVVVSGAGVLVGRYSSDNGATYRNFIGFPEQVHALAELAGTWNQIGMTRVSNGFVGVAGSIALTSAGVINGGSTCQNNSTWAIDACAPASAGQLALLAPLQADAAGGFDAGDAATHTTTARLFAYRSGSGSMMVVSVGNNGNFSTWTPQATLAPPAVGLTFRAWDLDMFSTLLSSYATYQTQSTVVSIDAATDSYLRTQGTIGQDYTYPTTIFLNSPRNGYVHRGAATATASDGRLVTLNEFSFLRLDGMGVSPVILPAPKQFEFSVTTP